MTRMLPWLCCALLAACDDQAAAGLPPASADDGGVQDGARHGAHFVVVSSNYTGATAVSLLDARGDVLDDVWLSSATSNPMLRTPLAQDVVAPTVSASRRFLTLLERGLGVVTRFDLDTGTVVGQVRVDDSQDGQSPYHANPQDVVYLDGSGAWISRWAPNPDPDAPEAQRGNDLVRFDPVAMVRVDGRIDLSPMDILTEQPRYDADGNVIATRELLATARPTGLVPVGEYLAVGIGRITRDFSYGPGALAIVDPESGEITDEVDLAPLRNCGSIGPVPGAPRQVLVACIGQWSELGPASGLALVAVDDEGRGRVLHQFNVADTDSEPAATQNVISLGGSLALGTTGGKLDAATAALEEVDRAYLIDLSDGSQHEVLRSEGAFSLGVGAFDHRTGTLLVPDAGWRDAPLQGVHRLVLDAGTVTPVDFVEVAARTGLAARQVRGL